MLVWDLDNLGAPNDGLKASNQQRLWKDLGSVNSASAFRAVQALTIAGAESVRLLARELHEPSSTDPEMFSQMLRDLDAEQFTVREKTAQALAEGGQPARSALIDYLKERRSPEARRKAEALLEMSKEGEPPFEERRVIRSVEVLENIGTSDALHLLEKLAKGASEARLTKEAKASLERLARRAAAVQPSKEKP